MHNIKIVLGILKYMASKLAKIAAGALVIGSTLGAAWAGYSLGCCDERTNSECYRNKESAERSKAKFILAGAFGLIALISSSYTAAAITYDPKKDSEFMNKKGKRFDDSICIPSYTGGSSKGAMGGTGGYV